MDPMNPNTHCDKRYYSRTRPPIQLPRTGCTVVLCPAGATAGVDVRGAAPGTRETEALRPGRLVQKAHAVLLTGGSAFGLEAAGGVVQYLEEQNVGFPAGTVRVPIAPAAVIFDLGVGDAKVRPDREMGYQACLNATDEPGGNGYCWGRHRCYHRQSPRRYTLYGGVGSACKYLDSGLIVAAIVVVNALGNVVNPDTGEIGGRWERRRQLCGHHGTAPGCKFSTRDKYDDRRCGYKCYTYLCRGESGRGDGGTTGWHVRYDPLIRCLMEIRFLRLLLRHIPEAVVNTSWYPWQQRSSRRRL